MTTTDTALEERTDGTQPSNVLRWTYSVIAIALAGVTAYLLAYTIGLLIGGSATATSTVIQLLAGFLAGALCVVFMRFASKHAPHKSVSDAS
jgi:hypothetical protein